MPVSNRTLMKIAALGGFATAAMGYALRSKINENISHTEYFKEAMQITHNHPGVVYLLGKPLKVGKIDVTDTENNWTKTLSAHYEVPVKGAKQKGTLYFWAERESELDKWSVNRIELQLANDTSKRLLVKGDL
ncbi:hypothetical protein PPYR_00897 [Photinus pyralis]|uniref:Cytochrome oxidase complex assembly protein 1 n=1 Tax=Photinus pyralis TaxID=7054 RepID=A0A1Y1ML14_PHOPY|nr:hypothetical protein PPYR_00897 [Photinus pyralis]